MCWRPSWKPARRTDILVDAKPHIGTDLLVGVVRNLRRAIEEAGGEVRFLTRLDGLGACGRGLLTESERRRCCRRGPAAKMAKPRIAAVRLVDERTGAEEVFATDCVVLACGHSARDTFQMVREAGAAMARKPFAVGVRIEHPQALVNEAQYGAGRWSSGPRRGRLQAGGEDRRRPGRLQFLHVPGRGGGGRRQRGGAPLRERHESPRPRRGQRQRRPARGSASRRLARRRSAGGSGLPAPVGTGCVSSRARADGRRCGRCRHLFGIRRRAHAALYSPGPDGRRLPRAQPPARRAPR